MFPDIWLVNSGDVLGRKEMLPTCDMRVLRERLNTKAEQCTWRYLSSQLGKKAERYRERSRRPCSGCCAVRPHPPFRTEALNFLGDLANTGAQLSCSMRIILSWGELFSPRSYLPAPPTTSQQLDIKPSPLTLTWDNSKEPFQLQNSRWKPLRWLYGASLCPTTSALPKERPACKSPSQRPLPATNLRHSGPAEADGEPRWENGKQGCYLAWMRPLSAALGGPGLQKEGGCLCLFTLHGAD